MTREEPGVNTPGPQPNYVHVGYRTILPFVLDPDGTWRWSGHVDERPELDPYEPSPDLASLIQHLAEEIP